MTTLTETLGKWPIADLAFGINYLKRREAMRMVQWSLSSFHHSVLHDSGISNLVLGYAHSGMVAAARWIAKLN
ncbi:hypothetical protein LWI28_009665 [Acer negundo]|uniref:Uncharacterized protein n=1 Tax=Acer negundo TaxID=4023 RepID=A0AAD5JDE4_ACENE|nr:hypothetical protein LWI28_009665 [Acer negundo]